MIAVNLTEKMILIGNTEYSGEMKKGVFGLLNFLLPAQGVMPMHCSANIGADGKSAIFFGLSGTGKTTLSADASRTLIGDDEHGWSDTAVFNFEGGCYAKMINLSAEGEPEIYATTKMFGTILENVTMDEDTRELDFTDASKTENTRGAYPIEFIPNTSEKNLGPPPSTIIFLTADAFGVLPPISRLTPDQAMYHFLSGYTAKVAGTEIGVTEPTATFSTCFGAAFMPRPPSVYGNLLKKRIAEGGAECWLVNTGWTGGKYGVGKRMPIKETRALLNAALDGSLNDVEFRKDPNFGFEVPVSVPGVDTSILDPRSTWANKDEYDATAAKLVDLFVENFAQFADQVDEGVRQAAPNAQQQAQLRISKPPRLMARSSDRAPQGPDHDRISPRFFASDAVERLGEGLLARDLPRAEWTHEAHLAATTYLVLRHPDIDLDAELPGSFAASTRALAA